ncbi:hypothetical protein SNEBB_003839 [Seison nebaliae]|nr:hypothetical protein SNEBB_003839 [Seison nebaliae]
MNSSNSSSSGDTLSYNDDSCDTDDDGGSTSEDKIKTILEKQLRIDRSVDKFLKKRMEATRSLMPNDFKSFDLPLARIKKIMKLDEQVQMISADVPVLLTKALEMFVGELAARSWISTEQGRRRTLQRPDVSAGVSQTDMFDFLIDIVPRDNRHPGPAYPNGMTSVDGINYQEIVQCPPATTTSSALPPEESAQPKIIKYLVDD